MFHSIRKRDGRIEKFHPEKITWAKVSEISLPIVVVVSVVLWATMLAWLLVERGRMDRRGPTLRDGLRTNLYR